jgi:SAM-dependent methyltransferase
VLKQKRISIVTLAPERACFWHLGVDYLFRDLTDLPFRDGYFDTVVSLSTIEHVGFDNSHYTGMASAAAAPGRFREAMGELGRVLKRRGSLYLSVPYGRRQQFPEFQQFDRGLLSEAATVFGPGDVCETFYRYSPDGWQLSDAESCADSAFVEWNTRPREWAGDGPIEPDRAVAARAVACVRMVKA